MLRVQSGTSGVEAGGDDAAVVENEQIAGTQDFGKIAEEVVTVFAGAAVEAEHAAGAAHGWRRLGDKFFGEIEIEVGYTH